MDSAAAAMTRAYIKYVHIGGGGDLGKADVVREVA